MTYTILSLKLKTVLSKPHSCKGSTYDSAFFLLVLRLNDARNKISNPEIHGKLKCRKREKKKDR
jgi:hypothetical protein